MKTNVISTMEDAKALIGFIVDVLDNDETQAFSGLTIGAEENNVDGILITVLDQDDNAWDISSQYIVLGENDAPCEEMVGKSVIYYQPTEKTLCENGYASSDVWFSRLYCMDDTSKAEEPQQYSNADIEQPTFVDLNGYNVSKFVLESLTECSDMYFDGTDKGKDYAFCIVNPVDADWNKAKSYLTSELSGEDRDEALKELDEVEKDMRLMFTVEDCYAVVYWNYN